MSILLGDLGGTNLRLALKPRDSAAEFSGREFSVRPVQDFASLEEALRDFLHSENPPALAGAALAVAGPVPGGDQPVAMTNHPWRFTASGIAKAIGVDGVTIVNDFAAVALSLPVLGPEDFQAVRGGVAEPTAPRAVLGPGTGLGVAGLMPPRGAAPALADVVSGEGGHVTLAARTEREATVLQRLRRRFGHVSAERLISGPGLSLIDWTLGELRGAPGAGRDPAAVLRAADAGEDSAVEALNLFIDFLATVASDLALTLGARGGVDLAGGVLQHLGSRFAEGEALARRFGDRFVDKGRFEAYLAPIPVRLIVHPCPALPGLARLFP